MAPDNNTPEEEAGIAVDTTAPEYDEGDDIAANKSVEVTVSRESSWRYNAGEIYKHTSSAVDELLSNSITAVVRARRMFGAWDAGVIVKIIERNAGEIYLVVRDEGIGMTEQFVDEVLSQIGITAGAKGEGVNSTFGRGFYSGWMLVGDEKADGSGAFELSTNPRFDEDWDADKPPHNVLCSPGKFDYVGDTESSLDADEYGTKLRFPIRDGIDADELEQWIRNYGTYSRTPIMFERHHPDGSMENDELGGMELEDSYDDDDPAVIAEKDGLYRAVASPSASGDVVILDAQTETSASLRFPLYKWWNVDIRLLNESGAIYKSNDPEKIGKTPVSESELEQVADNKRDDYVLKSNIDERTDYTLPKPSGTRDIIDLSREFRDQVFDALKQKTLSKVEDAVSHIDEPEDWEKLTSEQTDLLGSIIQKQATRWNLSKFIDSETRELLSTLSDRLRVVERGTTIEDRHDISNISREYVYDIIKEYDTIYYGKSILKRRAEAAWDDSDDAAIVQVENTDMYPKLKSLGWTKITDIRSTTISDMDVSDETVELFKRSTQNTGSNAQNGSSRTGGGVSQVYDDREIRVHRGRYAGSTKVTVGQIRDKFGDSDVDGHNADDTRLGSVGRLVLFTSTSDSNISDHKEIVDQYTATATIVNRVYEQKLADTDNVLTFEEYESHNTDYTLPTTDGQQTIGELADKSFRLFTTNEHWKQYITGVSEVDMLSNLFDGYSGLVVLASVRDLYAVRNLWENLDSDELSESKSTETIPIRDPELNTGTTLRGRLPWKLIVQARLPKWRLPDCTETRSMLNNMSSYSEEKQERALERYAALHDEDMALSSESELELSDHTPSLSVETSRGEMSLTELQSASKDVVVVPYESEVIGLLDPIPLETVESFLIEEQEHWSYRASFDTSGLIVVAGDYDLCQKVTRHVFCTVAKPGSASDVGNATVDQLDTYYTPLYSYAKLRDTDIDHDEVRPVTENEQLVSDGYHFVNTTMKAHEVTQEGN